MRLRTFSAPNMTEAMRMVREELGPEAVILSSEQVGKAVKLTAALERPDVSAFSTKDRSDPDIVSRIFEFHHFPQQLAERLSAIAQDLMLDDPRAALIAALRARFSFKPLAERKPVKPLLLVGMPGAGKSSTVAKLAARGKVKNWPVTLITCDLLKAGSLEQLAIYAKALDVPAFRAKDAATLKRAVERAQPESLIVIDTLGTNPFNPDELAALRELSDAAGSAMVLVHPAGGDVSESAELAMLYAEIGADALIATKTDAARRYGGIFAAADGGKLAFSEIGISPEIAGGLKSAGPEALCDLLMPRERATTRGYKAQNLQSGRPL